MGPQRALEQIDQIHSHLARTEVFRGFRAIPVGLTGVTAFLGAIFQDATVHSPHAFVGWWMAVAALNLLIAAATTIWHHVNRSPERDRRKTLIVVSHFIPPVVVGFIITVAIITTHAAMIPLLPGIWALVFSLGLFASRPFLPHAIGWIGLFYVVCGAQLLMMASSGASMRPWSMGLTFGIGQLATAGALFWNLERKADDAR